MRAVLWNHQAVAEVLVKSGCDIHVRATVTLTFLRASLLGSFFQSGNDALALASGKGWHELVRLCLNKHVDVNGSNRVCKARISFLVLDWVLIDSGRIHCTSSRCHEQ